MPDPTPTTLIVGCGYLGRRVGRLLVRRGARVLGTTRSAARAAALAADGIEPVVADVLDPSALARLPAAARVLYCVGYDRAAGVPMRTVYVDGLQNTLDALADRVGRLVYASSTSVYGTGDGGWVDEESPAEPTSESGAVCLDAERRALAWGAGRGVACVVVRFSGLYGPGRVIGRAALERGEPIAGDPSRTLNLIQIHDAAAAAALALDRGAAGRVYLASDDRPLPRREFYTLAASLLGAPPPRFEPPTPGTPAARREGANRRVSNRRIKAELGLTLAHPDVFTGLPATMEEEWRIGEG